MQLEVLRFSSQKDSTNGYYSMLLGEKRKFLCYTLEDEHREEKVSGETRVPAGTYDLVLRKVGGFHSRYSKKYGSMHKGMPWVWDVPNLSTFLYTLVILMNTLLRPLLVIVNKQILVRVMVSLVRAWMCIKVFILRLLRL